MQRPTEEELQKIVSFSQKNSDAVLDRPEQFLLDLSRISCYEERLYCMMFKTTVSDSLSEIGQKLTNFRLVCEVSTVHVFVFKKVMLNHQQINSQTEHYQVHILLEIKGFPTMIAYLHCSMKCGEFLSTVSFSFHFFPLHLFPLFHWCLAQLQCTIFTLD